MHWYILLAKTIAAEAAFLYRQVPPAQQAKLYHKGRFGKTKLCILTFHSIRVGYGKNRGACGKSLAVVATSVRTEASWSAVQHYH